MNPVPRIPRDPKIEDKYTLFKSKIKDMELYVYQKYLDGKTFSLKLNPFPYDISDDVTHYVLWIDKKKWPTWNSHEEVNLLLSNKFDNFCFFKNDTANQSIPTIAHYHTFVKN